MPDGPYVHRAAAALRVALGRPLTVRAHQSTLAPLARALDGRRLVGVEAYGKHLVLALEAAPRLHLHLGVRGALRRDDRAIDAALSLRSDDDRWCVHDPHRCELVDDGAFDMLLARLGHDPLRDPTLHDSTRQRLHGTRQPIGAALLDQSVVAGAGNDLRAEVLHACRVHPERAAASLDDTEVECVWTTLVRMMVAARDDPHALDPPTANGGEHHRVHEVYRRKRCARCGLRVKRTRILERTAYFCPRCQR
jgi:formamidopyrimidine-DNA glycosylase